MCLSMCLSFMFRHAVSVCFPTLSFGVKSLSSQINYPIHKNGLVGGRHRKWKSTVTLAFYTLLYLKTTIYVLRLILYHLFLRRRKKYSHLKSRRNMDHVLFCGICSNEFGVWTGLTFRLWLLLETMLYASRYFKLIIAII